MPSIFHAVSIGEPARRRSISSINRLPRKTRIPAWVWSCSVAMQRQRSAQPGAGSSSKKFRMDVRRDGTDLEQALEVAIGSFDADGDRRVVLMSDGRENHGHALSAAAIARSVGVEINTISPRGDNCQRRYLVERLSAPPWVRVQSLSRPKCTFAAVAPLRQISQSCATAPR